VTRLESEKINLYSSAIIHTATHEKPEVTSLDAIRAVDEAEEALLDAAYCLRLDSR